MINKHTPLKFACRKQKRLLQKPWITKDIHGALRRKPKMYKTHFKSGDPHKIAKYMAYANKVNHLKEINKNNYFHNVIPKKNLIQRKRGKR